MKAKDLDLFTVFLIEFSGIYMLAGVVDGGNEGDKYVVFTEHGGLSILYGNDNISKIYKGEAKKYYRRHFMKRIFEYFFKNPRIRDVGKDVRNEN